MNQNELLDSELITTIPLLEDVTEGNFKVLIPSLILERFAYYGFRSLIVLYVVFEFELDKNQALVKYGFFTSLIYITALPGGILGDFVFKLKKSLILGCIIAAVGAGFCAMQTLNLFYLGCFFVILGSALYRPNIMAYTARITGADLRLLEQRFLSLYMGINIGAFFGTFLLGLISETFGYSYGFIIVALAWLVSAILLYAFTSHSYRKTSQQIYIKINKYLKPSVYTMAFLIIPLVASTCFWLSYEHFYPRYDIAVYELTKAFNQESTGNLLIIYTGALITIPLGLILLFLFRKRWFHPLYKMAIGMALMAIAWGVIYIFPASPRLNPALTIYILSSLFMGISELFISPVILTLIGAMAPKKVLGTITGVYFLFSGVGISIGSTIVNYYDPNSTEFFLPLICVGFSLLLLSIPYFLKKD